MAQYRAIIRGNRGETSRLGSKKSGIFVSVNGWHKGVDVYGRFNEKTGKDEFVISETGGSQPRESSKVIKIIK